MEESLDVRMVQSVAPATPSTTYNNKVPKKGEIIFNNGLNNFKVGNGSTSYGNLNDFLGKTITNVSTDTTSTPHKTTITFSDESSVVISDGNDGTSVSIKENEAACQEIGDGYIASNGHLMVLTTLNPRTFNDAGEIKGPRGATWFNGTAVTSTTSNIPAGSSIAVGDYYLNTDTYVVWKCLSLSDTTKWQNLGCIKGTSAYLYIRFANNNQPLFIDMHTSWQPGDTYIGFQVTTSSTASTYYGDYTWAEFTGTDTTYQLTLNGITNGDGEDLGTFYAPTTAGTSNQILVSGNASPSWQTISTIPESGTKSAIKVGNEKYTIGMGATNTISAEATITPISNEMAINEVFFYQGNNVTLQRVEVEVDSVARQGLKINAANNSVSQQGSSDNAEYSILLKQTDNVLNETGSVRYCNSGNNGDNKVTVNTSNGALTAKKFVVRGYTTNGLLKADGSVDSNTYFHTLSSSGSGNAVTNITSSGNTIQFTLGDISATMTVTQLADLLVSLINQASSETGTGEEPNTLKNKLALFFTGLVNITGDYYRTQLSNAFYTILHWRHQN